LHSELPLAAPNASTEQYASAFGAKLLKNRPLAPPAVAVRRLVEDEHKEKREYFASKCTGLCDQGSQIITTTVEEVATPSKQTTYTYSIDRNGYLHAYCDSAP